MYRGMLIIIFFTGFLTLGCSSENQEKPVTKTSVHPLITFVELGSVNCIPCKQMQPVMTSIENKYGDQIAVVFHDVWQADQKHYARQYGIRLIPTQVFLDSSGNELMRHEGFFPEAEIDAFLISRGLTISEQTKSL